MNIPHSATSEVDLAPVLVSVKQAAQMLGISPWSCYQLLDEGAIVSRYIGRRRLVEVESLRAYAQALPTVRPNADEAAGA